jgi:predicted transcriptional regulator
MGIIKENNYSQDDLSFALLGRALAHPARKRIIDIIQEDRISTSVVLAKRLNLSIKATCDHLIKLREAKLILDHYSIHFHEIRLNPIGFEKLEEYIEKIINLK